MQYSIQFGYWQKGTHNFCFWEDAQKQQEDQTWERLFKFLWSLIEKEPHLQDLGMTGTNKKNPLWFSELPLHSFVSAKPNEPPESRSGWTCRKRKLPVSSITMLHVFFLLLLAKRYCIHRFWWGQCSTLPRQKKGCSLSQNWLSEHLFWKQSAWNQRFWVLL